MSLLRNKAGQIVSSETIKWIIAIAVIVAVSFAIRNIAVRAVG